MRAILLHLSDIHFSTGPTSVISRTQNIADTLTLCSDEECVCFIILSGDIARSGNSQEYAKASLFFSKLKEEILQNKKIHEIHFIAVPGNHDCNFENAKGTRVDLISHLGQIEKPNKHIGSDHISDFTSIQKEYFDFAAELTSIDNLKNPIFWHQRFKVDSRSINFLCFNTAWMSMLRETQGNLIFPLNFVDLVDISKDVNTVNISVFHHPYNWFDSRHVKEFKNFINENSEIIITGHEHDIDMQIHVSIKGKIHDVMEGGVLHLSDSTESSFNIEVIDLNARLQKKLLLVWDDLGKYYKPEGETEWSQFLALEAKAVFSIRDDFKKSLSRLDVQIINPKSLMPLEINDIYVNPSLDIEYSRDGIIARRSVTTSDLNQLVDTIKEYHKVLIIGNKYCGKTLLLKKLFTIFYEDNLTPLFCRYRDFIQLGKQPINSIKRLFENQYINSNDVQYQKYRQLPMDKKVILIDDLSKTGLDIGKIEVVLNTLQDHFGLIIISSNPIININEMLNGPGSLIDYTRVRVNELGLPTISDIIEKWTALIHPEDTKSEVQSRIRAVENNLFNIISRDIPRNPFFILTILYKIELEKSPEAQTGAYGYYFQTIINVMIAKIAGKPDSIGYIFDYFSNLAFHMLTNKVGRIDRTEIEDINEHYLNRTGFTLDLPQIINNALKEEILIIEEDAYSFSHNYYFEYFAAQYISDNIRNPNMQEYMKEIIENISLHIHKEVYSNIMMFLCFHSRDPIILEVVNDKARSIFRDLGEFDIHKDVEFLNKLSPSTKIHYISEKPTEETKRELLEAQDSIMNEVEEIRYGLIQDVNSIDELTILNKIIYGFSLVRVLGQIIKRYLPGGLEDRIANIKELYDLGLQTIKYVLYQIESDMENTQEGIANYIIQRNPSIAPDKLSTATNDWIWSLSESVCLGSIKNLSQNVGAPELKKIYKIILERYPSIAYEFIDISIQFDHFEGLPERKILKLVEKLDESNNYFCKDLLSLLFLHHIYQVYTPIQQIQRIASKLGLEHMLNEPNIFLAGKKILPRKRT